MIKGENVLFDIEIALIDKMKAKLSDFEIVNGVLTAYSGIDGEIVIPENVSKIDSDVFNSCEFITQVTISSNVEEIGEGAFSNCVNLSKILFENTSKLKIIGENAFYGCKIEKLTLPDSVTEIKNESFCSNKSLRAIALPYGLKTIGAAAFQRCEALKSVRIPVGVSHIDRLAFADCGELVIYTAEPKKPENWDNSWNSNGEQSCEVIWNAADEDKAESIKAESAGTTELNFKCKDYEVSNGELIRYCDKKSEFAVPDGVTSIGWAVFKDAKKLVKINIPASVTIIRNCAFQNCGNLKTVRISEGSKLAEIGENAFLNCKELTRVIWQDNCPLIRIKKQAFANCSELQNIIIPKSLTTIDKYAFFGTSMTNVEIPQTVQFVGECAFYNKDMKNIVLKKDCLEVDSYELDAKQSDSATDESAPLKICVFKEKRAAASWDINWHAGCRVVWNYDGAFHYNVSAQYEKVISIDGLNTNLKLFNHGNLLDGRRCFRKSDVTSVKIERATFAKNGFIGITLCDGCADRVTYALQSKTGSRRLYDSITYFNRSQNELLNALEAAFKQNGIKVE